MVANDLAFDARVGAGVSQEHRVSLGSHVPRETLADFDRKAAWKLFLEADGGAQAQGIALTQEHDGRIDGLGAIERRAEEVVQERFNIS